jgi:outer membrane protein OmpA-like peptidoglycan-associated protein
MKRFQSFFVILATSAIVVYGQDAWTWRAGLFGAGTLNMHSGAFSTYEGLQGCGSFSDATTMGWTLGNLLDVRFGNSWGAQARLGLWDANGTFNDPAPVAPLVALQDGSLVRLPSSFDLNTTVDVLTLDLLATYELFPRLHVAFGPHVGYVSRASFEQSEELDANTPVRFANGGTSRLILSAPFDQGDAMATTRNLRLGATAQVSYEFPIAKRVDLAPEVAFTMPFTSVLSSFSWSINMLRAGIRVTYEFSSDPPPPAPVEAPPPAPAPVATLMPPYVLLDVTATAADGSSDAVSEVVLSEARSFDVVPLLPNVFFDSLSAALPARYVRRTGRTSGFAPAALGGDVLTVYHDILNIIGQRLQQRPSATLSIMGHREPQSGEIDAALAMQRAEAVRDYLVATWGIDAGRLLVASRELPQRPSNRTVADGRDENRRVELSTNDPAIMAPVRRTSTRASIAPSPIRVLPTVAPEGPAQVRVVAADGTTLREETVATGSQMQWSADPATVAGLIGRGHRRVTVTATSGEGDMRREARHVIGLRRHRSEDGASEADTIRERHRLVFFGFDDDRISAIDQQHMDALQARLRTSSKITVTGYTDRIGDAGYNTGLSTRRAVRVANTLRERIVPEVVRERGAGPELIHDNNLPEGRMYNRTVVIDVATPRDAGLGDE